MADAHITGHGSNDKSALEALRAELEDAAEERELICLKLNFLSWALELQDKEPYGIIPGTCLAVSGFLLDLSNQIEALFLGEHTKATLEKNTKLG